MLGEAKEDRVLNTGRGCDHEPYGIPLDAPQFGRLGRRSIVG
jgi:hypothetical protein